jgi:hypothetical protein
MANDFFHYLSYQKFTMLKIIRYLFLLCIAWSLLLVPWVASFITKEVQWTTADYVAAAILLTIFVTAIEWTLRKSTSMLTRIFLLVAIAAIFIIAWLELSVGLFQTTFSGS